MLKFVEKGKVKGPGAYAFEVFDGQDCLGEVENRDRICLKAFAPLFPKDLEDLKRFMNGLERDKVRLRQKARRGGK